MIHETRVRALNDGTDREGGKYVLYWMQSSQRVAFNHALEHAIAEANERQMPVVVCFGLMDDYPEANERHYAFMLEGLAEVERDLHRRGIRFVCKHGQPAEVALHYGRDAAMIVCDRGYTRHQKAWRDRVADEAKCAVVQVESDVVVPVEEVSEKQEHAARTIRPKIHRLWEDYLVPLKAAKVTKPSLGLRVRGDIDVSDPRKALAKLKLDRSVGVSPLFRGGASEAGKRLGSFIQSRLQRYKEGRNEPSESWTTTLGGYLHFGQIAALEVALRVRDADAPPADREALLEELIVRRELAHNFVHYCPHYDRYECVPQWARKTLSEHRNDKRPILYSRAQLESGETGDPYWNAAQREITLTGYMHNYMRMYWGKKILEWTKSPEEAYEVTIWLNNRYFLCGRNPNAWANVAWIFGLHDRPWGPERQIFGLVRYMNARGLERKFDISAYVDKVERLGRELGA